MIRLSNLRLTCKFRSIGIKFTLSVRRLYWMSPFVKLLNAAQKA